jgi:hypothetical protein
LLRKKLIYTGGSGAGVSDAELDSGPDFSERFARLSDRTRGWVVLRLLCHPNVVHRVKQVTDNEGDIELDSVPERYMEDLVNLASRVDGTLFCENLDASYSSPRWLGLVKEKAHKIR